MKNKINKEDVFVRLRKACLNIIRQTLQAKEYYENMSFKHYIKQFWHLHQQCLIYDSQSYLSENLNFEYVTVSFASNCKQELDVAFNIKQFMILKIGRNKPSSSTQKIKRFIGVHKIALQLTFYMVLTIEQVKTIALQRQRQRRRVPSTYD